MSLHETSEALPATDQPVASHWRDAVRGMFRPAADLSRHSATLYERTLNVYLSADAERAVTALSTPLTVELELLFSCFVRKATRFHSALPDAASPAASQARVADNLYLQFHPITTQHCRMADSPGEPPNESMPLTKPRAFVPRWVSIDYRHGQWLGEFGY